MIDQLLNFAHPGILLLILIVASIGAFIHGLTGLGFPLIATPLIAMLVDFKTAILITVIPTIVINLFSIIKGGNWHLSLGKHWPIAIYMVLGSIVGTHFVIYLNPDFLKLLLAAMILLYLNTERFKHLHASWLERFPRVCEGGFGLAAGILSGTTNVSAPPLIIYFSLLGLAPIVMVQILNFCFIASKATQVVTFGVAGELSYPIFLTGITIALISVCFLIIGMRVQDKIRVETYRVLLNKTLLVMAIILILQSVISMATS